MCSVVGYIGKNYSRAFVMEGLSRLEYRGYDSAGFACLAPESHRLLYAKAEGRLSNLAEKFEHTPIDGHLGIGHTRWSTHGAASEKNAHPHFDCQKTISVVHNGIIENYDALRKELITRGYNFKSDTDTEVLINLIEDVKLKEDVKLGKAVQIALNQVIGAYSIAVFDKARKL